MLRNGDSKGENKEVASFKVNKYRSEVRMKFQNNSLHRRVVIIRVWILQTRTWGIITSEMFTILSHYITFKRTRSLTYMTN